MKHLQLSLSIVLITISMILLAEEPITTLSTITIEAERPPEPGISRASKKKDILAKPTADGGEFLRSIPGVSGSRMGGHGIDPVIRGQSQNQLNILLDGAYVHGGCPNRMDPPTAYSPIETYDNVTVIKGSQTVIYGGGGSGGTVLLERNTPRLSKDKHMRGHIGGGYSTNSETKEAFADMTLGNEQGFVRGIIEYKDAGNYKDGDGNTTRSSFNSQTGSFIFGYTPSNKTRLELSLEANRIDDALYAGARMDSPKSDNNTMRLKFKNEGTKVELYRSEVDHVMDNFSLRTLTAPMKMLVNTQSETQGGRISHNWLTAKELEWTMGLDYQQNSREANRLVGPANVSTPSSLQSIMWPGADLKQIGVFGEMLMPINEVNIFKIGLRYDRVTSEASRANQTAMGGISPNQLYNTYYGKTATTIDENNFSGFLRYEHELSQQTVGFITLSRSVRTADATERFLAGNSSTAALRWIGNPDLDPEQHHQLELGFSWQQANLQSTTSIFYNNVTDFILRDRAHAQSGILQNDNATIYRNVDARLYGIEWEAKLKWNKWTNRVSLSYVHATNTTEDRAIAQTPPLMSTIGLDYKHNHQWRVGSNLRMAAKQTRVDDNILTGSGLDAEQTSSFAVLDLFGVFDINKQTAITLGINNIFDQTYAYHVNRANLDPFNPEAIQVNEPGRAIWLNLSAKF